MGGSVMSVVELVIGGGLLPVPMALGVLLGFPTTPLGVLEVIVPGTVDIVAGAVEDAEPLVTGPSGESLSPSTPPEQPAASRLAMINVVFAVRITCTHFVWSRL
jgi:hypothetical protein